MTTPPPPPPGNGPNQPYDPSGSAPPPPGQGGPGQPSSYGSGQPPQSPPPGPGGPPQGGGGKGKVMAIISIVVGVLGLCYAGCFIFSIVAIILGALGKKDAEQTGDSSIRTMALVGLVLGIVGIVLGILSWTLQLTGVWEPYSYNFETS